MTPREYLENAFAFYQSYHSDPINRGIHIISIPLIVWTILIWLAAFPFYTFDSLVNVYWQQALVINAGVIAIGGYTVMYVFMDKVGAMIVLITTAVQYAVANLFVVHVPYPYLTALGIHIFAWIIQIMGHKYFEHNRPALCDSLVQAFIMAPLFVWLELLFMMGFKKDLQRKITRYASVYRPINTSDQ